MLGVDDIALFYDRDAFGQVAIWETNIIDVIFDKTYAEQFGMASNNPVLRAPAASFVGIARSQPIFVDSTNYLVQGFKPDGRGEIIIELVKA